MTVLVKGSHVKFDLKNGSVSRRPVGHGIIHDESGQVYPKDEFYIGPYKKTRRSAALTKDAKAYFGKNYAGVVAIVDVPDGPWEPFAVADQIWYRRPGKYSARYYHLFDKKTVVFLSKCGEFIRVEMGEGSIYNDRGIVRP